MAVGVRRPLRPGPRSSAGYPAQNLVEAAASVAYNGGTTTMITRTRYLFAAIICGAFIALAGCGSGDLTLGQADPKAVPADPSFDLVFSIIERECVSCHGSDSSEERPNLSTCEDVVAQSLLIETEVLIKNSMPPGAQPRLTSEEKLIIERWLENGAKAPCN